MTTRTYKEPLLSEFGPSNFGAFPINPEYMKVAKTLVGKKAILNGGGSFMQEFWVVGVKDVLDDGYAVLDTKGFHYPYDKVQEFTPLLASWYLVPLKDQRAALGKYDMLRGKPPYGRILPIRRK